MAGDWRNSFRRGDSFGERMARGAHRPLPAPMAALPPAARSPHPPAPAPEAQHGRCSRGDWCSGRAITVEQGIRTVTPAATPRAYCDGCQDHITACLLDFPRLYRDLHAEIAEHRAGEVLVRVPFGPAIPLNTAADALMRAMTETLCSWELRIRDLADLSDLGAHENEPQDELRDLERSLAVIIPAPDQHRMSMLLSLAPQEMVRFVAAWAVAEEDQDAEVAADNAGILKLTVMLDGRRAGQEIMHLHYMARRLLLETSAPMPLLPDFRCRVCEQKLLRKAPPPWHEDGEWYWSRCDGCGDEMTREEYDTNAKRWLAYERAHLETARLAG
jgi:hypothetical protein